MTIEQYWAQAYHIERTYFFNYVRDYERMYWGFYSDWSKR